MIFGRVIVIWQITAKIFLLKPFTCCVLNEWNFHRASLGAIDRIERALNLTYRCCDLLLI